METLWNTMISYLLTSLPTKGFEPGSMEYSNIFPSINFSKFKSPKLSNESFRNIILHSFDSFNNGYFFVIMQIALCIYCPSIALAIIYQQYHLEQQDLESQPQSEQDYTQFKQNKQNISQDPKQQFVMRQLTQFIQSIFQNVQQEQMQQMQMQMQGQQQQPMQQQLSQSLRLQMQQKTIKISTQIYNNENGGSNAKIAIIIQILNAELGEEGQVYTKKAGQVQNIIIF